MYRDFWRHVRAALEKRFGPLLLLSGESWNSGAPLHRGAEFAIEGLNVFDGSFIYSPSFVWVLHKRSTYEHNWKRWVVRNVLQAQYERGAGHRVIATVNPAYDDRALRKKKGFRIDARGPRGDTYDLTWKLALDLSPDLVLISTWNEFFEGSAIEPTHEHGDAFLARTHEWSKRLRAPRARTKRGLVVTGEASAHFTAGLADPSVEGRYAHDLQVLVERDLGGISWEAVDVESAAQKDFARYDLILVEPGLEVGTRATDLASRLEHWAEAGGRLLMSGASAGSVWQRLVHASGNGDLQAVVRAGAIALPPGARPRAWQLEGDVEPFLSYDGDHKPAAWLRHVGSGEIVGTSFNVAGREHYPGSDASLAFCGSIAPLLSSGLACKNADPAVVP